MWAMLRRILEVLACWNREGNWIRNRDGRLSQVAFG